MRLLIRSNVGDTCLFPLDFGLGGDLRVDPNIEDDFDFPVDALAGGLGLEETVLPKSEDVDLGLTVTGVELDDPP